MSIPHRQGTTNVQNSSDYREYPVVSIPHRQGTTNCLLNYSQMGLRKKFVSIPHRQGTTFEDALQKCGIIKNVSIPHRQGTTFRNRIG